jgi:RNA polymerase sigma-70 factor (ECF subfamily)
MSSAPPVEGLDQEPLALVQQAGREGWSDAAFETIYRRYHPRFLSFFRRRVESPEAAQELAQDVMLKVSTSSGRFDSLASFEAWMTAIAHNAVKNHWRSAKAQKRQGAELPVDALDGRRGPLPDPLEVVLKTEQSARLAKALEQLPPAVRNAAVLRFQKGRSYDEIARLQGVSINTVKSHVHDAKKRLTELLGVPAEE